MRVEDRWDYASKNKLCFKCLGEHFSPQCTRVMKCNIDGCSKNHNRLLHGTKEGEPMSKGSCDLENNAISASGSKNNTSGSTRPTFHSGACGQISFRVVPVLVSSPNGKVVEANAFLDDGSEQTYVNEDLVAELGIHGKPEEVKATVLNGKEERFQSFPVKFDISPLNRPEKQYGIEAITIKNVCGKLKPIDWCRVSRDWDHLKDIEFPKFLGSRNKVDILIGLDHAGLHESIHEVKGRSGEPIARLTPLGYTCVGPVAPAARRAFHTRSVSTFHCTVDREVNITLRKFWEVDNMGLNCKVTCHTKEEEEAIRVVIESMAGGDNCRYQVRIVYDASAKDRDLCLNDVINNGPKLQNDLCDVLLRFRRDKVAVVCDISEMYLQIEIDEVDRPMFRFMWRDLDVQKEPGTYEFNRLIFGLNVSPFIAQKVSQENAKRYKEQFPRAAETVLTSTYMDDSMDSVEDEDVAIQLYRELTELWAKAGMSARKWLSNSKKVLEAIPVEHRAKEIKITDSEWPSIKALGLTWLAESDVLCSKAQIEVWKR
ncbi:hypothetical protein BSL78_15560 [Apostichopus japonicus]|uniref:Reverse transcriptase domain-containing protein n=1 Tax=Stichopus japonicus TaxID=307972 RepID=A0A2G8KHU9_STIJA|nr:hypothetical protein BSL78_15560 [Apostichopus japonicus]